MMKSKNECPKCKAPNGLNGNLAYLNPVIHCYSCGLSHAVGTSKESLKKQIQGKDYRNPMKGNEYAD